MAFGYLHMHSSWRMQIKHIKANFHPMRFRPKSHGGKFEFKFNLIEIQMHLIEFRTLVQFEMINPTPSRSLPVMHRDMPKFYTHPTVTHHLINIL